MERNLKKAILFLLVVSSTIQIWSQTTTRQRSPQETGVKDSVREHPGLFLSQTLPRPDGTVSQPGVRLDYAGQDLQVAPARDMVHAPHRLTPTSRKGACSRRIGSVGDLAGDWVFTSKTMHSYEGQLSGGFATQIVPKDGTDSVTMHFEVPGFPGECGDITAFVDVDGGFISIPRQSINEKVTLTGVALGYQHADGTAVDVDIQGTFLDDGSIRLSSWGILYNGSLYNAYYAGGSYFRRPNATVTERRLDVLDGEVVSSEYAYPVLASQPAKNRLEVVNYGNYGMTLAVELRNDHKAKIEERLVNPYGSYYLYNIGGDYSLNPDGTLSASDVHATFETDEISDGSRITLSDCVYFSPYRYDYLALVTQAEIDLDFDVVFPDHETRALSGSGSESDPYRISDMGDWISFTDAVNDRSQAYNKQGYHVAYEGEHVVLDNDIDCAGYILKPVGNSLTYRFGGLFDGKGHTLRNVWVSEDDSHPYTGLFGVADEGSSIRGLRLDGVRVDASRWGCGAIAGSADEVADCEVRAAAIANLTPYAHQYSMLTGGIAGQAVQIIGCRLVDSEVRSTGSWLGGIAGLVAMEISGCEATDCRVSSDYYGWGDMEHYHAEPIGGLAGEVSDQGLVERCAFTGDVTVDVKWRTPNSHIVQGGLVGLLREQATVDQSCFVGRVLGGNSDHIRHNMAGMVGHASPGSAIFDCYAMGNIWNPTSNHNRFYALTSDGNIAGNRVGDGGADLDMWTRYQENPILINNCYAVMPEATHLVGGVGIWSGTEVCHDNQIASTSMDNGLSTSELTASGGTLFASDVWVKKEGFYPTLRCHENSAASVLGAVALHLAADNTIRRVSEDASLNVGAGLSVALSRDGVMTGRHCAIDGSDLLLTTGAGRDTLYVSNGKSQWYLPLVVSPGFDNTGDGTAENPYLLSSKEDFMQLQVETNVAKKTYLGKHFRVTNDIYFGYDNEWIGLEKFSGVLDGSSYQLHEMTSPLMQRLSNDGVVKNVIIASDCNISCPQDHLGYLGTISNVNDGLIENCINYSELNDTITSKMPSLVLAGGITGSNSGRIINCLNAGNIHTVGGAAGIVYNCWGSVDGCVNLGNIAIDFDHMSNVAAGIAGQAKAQISNVLNMGCITAPRYAAGIAGFMNSTKSLTISNAMNAGTIVAKNSDCGIFVTKNQLFEPFSSNPTVNLSYCVADCHLSTRPGEFETDICQMETSQMTDGTAIEGFDEAVWNFSEGRYPMLKNFIGNEMADHARSVICYFENDCRVNNVTTDVSLKYDEGVYWELSKGGDYVIDDYTLHPLQGNNQFITDSLWCYAGNYKKLLVISRAVALEGIGTFEQPYLITSPESWNQLNEYMGMMRTNFEGCYLKLVEDLNFEDIGFEPIAQVFNGHLQGNGKKMTGIHLIPSIQVSEESFVIGQQFGLIYRLGAAGVIENLTVEGDITVEGTFVNVGGIVGISYGSLYQCNNLINIRRGKISWQETGYGGIVGLMCGGEISNCINYAPIDCDCFSGVAGIVGIFQANQNKKTIKNCINNQTICGKGTVAGILGGAMNVMAGIVGVDIMDCVNNGDIIASSGASGILSCYTDVCKVTRSVNLKPVSGSQFVYGISLCDSISNSYNVGQVLLKDVDPRFAVYSSGNIGLNGQAGNYYVTDFGYVEGDAIGTPVTLAELCAMDMNNSLRAMMAGGDAEPAWENYDDYSLPMPATIADLDIVKAAAAEVIVADGDTRDHVTQDFHVGLPEGCEWTVDIPVVEFADNDAHITATYHDIVILTVTAGDFSKTIELCLDAEHSHIDTLTTDADVVTERWYTVAGIEVPRPADRDGQVYIVVQQHRNGQVTATKVLN